MKNAIIFIFLFLQIDLVAQIDLSPIKNFDYSKIYCVKVNGVVKPVFQSKQSYQKRGGTIEQGNGIQYMSFVNFDLPKTGAANIEIKLGGNANEYEIRPFSFSSTVIKNDSTMKISLSESQKFVIKKTGTWENVLCVFVNPYQDKPDKSSVTYYFDNSKLNDYYTGSATDPSNPQKDIQKKEEVGAIDLKDGQSIYLEEGAILRARINVPNNATVKIFGRGMLVYGVGHNEDFGVVAANLGPKKITIEGITVVDSPGWIFRIFGGANHIIDNAKTVGMWHFNTDGIQFGGNDSEIKNCFFQCNDDNFSFSGAGKNMKVYNNLLWNLFNGGVFNFGWGNPKYSDSQFYNNTILRAGDCCDVDSSNPTPEVERRKAPFTMISYGGEDLQRITFTNNTVEEITGKGTWIHFIVLQSGTGKVDNIVFKNTTVINQQNVWAVLHGSSGKIKNITFDNLTINGKVIKSANDGALTLVNTENINFTFPTSIKVDNSIPKEFELYQNYPNPFNPSTTIKYSVPDLSQVSIVIYNLIGEKIKTLVAELKDTGTFQTVWDGKNEKNNFVSSGMYFVNLVVSNSNGTFIKNRKIILMK